MVNVASQGPDPAQTQEQITAALSGADAQVSQAVQTLQQVYQARLNSLTRAAAAAQTQHGPASPQYQQAQSAVTDATLTVGRISLVKAKVATPAPQVSATGWALHGRIVDASCQPMSGFTVYLVDAEKAYQSAYGFAYTDATGYFLINNPGTTPAPAGAAPAPGAAAAAQLYVAAADANAQPVYVGTTPFQPVTGSAAYQEIVLPSGDAPIGNPPADIRKTALPTAAKK